MGGIIFSVSYLLFACAEAYRIASYESGIAIRISDKARVALLIFSFKWPKISVLAVVYQICTYILYGFFLLSRLDGMQSFLAKVIPDINQIYTWAIYSQMIGLFLIAMIEEGVYYLRVIRKRK